MRNSRPIVLLGLGFTTRRLAKRLLRRGESPIGIARQPAVHADLGITVHPLDPALAPREAILVHTIPPLNEPVRSRLHEFLSEIEPRRVVYISATSVYGDQVNVDEATPAHPSGEKSVARFEEEQWLLSNTWSNLIIRPAAIYGPGRGVQERIREGKLPRGSETGVVSRIHVDDLVSVLDAGIHSDLEGAWPLADQHPCPSEEIAAFCARLLKIHLPGNATAIFPVAGRNVNGHKILELLGVRLKYPNYESGIPASLAESR